MSKYRMLAVNEKGYRIGEDRHGAKLSDAQVDELLALIDGGTAIRSAKARAAAGLTHRALALRFGVSRGTISGIASGRRRGQIPDRYVSRAARRGGAPEHAVHLPEGFSL